MMERNAQKHGLINLALLLVVSVATFGVSRYSHALAGQVTAAILGLGLLVAGVSWFQMRLEAREHLEKLEFDEVTRGGAASSTIFSAQEVEVFPARRAREQFEKYFVPAFTLMLLLLEGGGAWWLGRWLGQSPATPTLRQPLVAMAILGLCALILFLLGQFSSGLARLEKHRFLQAGSSFLLLGAYLLALVVAAIAGVQSGVAALDLILARAFCWLLGVLAVENLLTLLLEIYRPRVKGKVVRLLYESRLIGLISHPEGIFTTVAHTLDYQFGFKVSDTWFYQFLQQYSPRLLLFYCVILAGSTCLVYIEPGEEVLLERFGKPVPGRDVLGSGFHFKLPWPVEKAYRYRTQEIQSFDIGFEHDEKEQEEAAVLWTVSHYKEEFRLLVASREPVEALPGTARGRKAPPVNLLSVGIPLQYQIHDLRAWAYNYRDAAQLLNEIATREVVRYLVGVDVNEIMSTARFTAGEELRRRIQARADDLKLGVKILFVGLQDVHPPVQVGGAYEKFVGSKQKREADILKARAYAIRTNALANAEATRKKLEATAESTRKVGAAAATESLFTNQMTAFLASPDVYSQRAYLQTLARHGSGVRKYIRILTNAPEVYQLNLEDKFRDDILNVPMPAPKTK